jgi:hypothetical protein
MSAWSFAIRCAASCGLDDRILSSPRGDKAATINYWFESRQNWVEFLAAKISLEIGAWPRSLDISGLRMEINY